MDGVYPIPACINYACLAVTVVITYAQIVTGQGGLVVAVLVIFILLMLPNISCYNA